ncbi:MAG: hypothetical protein C7B44_05665 [Sulfobacillus thermosulfidooxidans]|nr:MAG: hypothetical protein C7B44_05665 [Sulfobacillus thermosulfidooxidans]
MSHSPHLLLMLCISVVGLLIVHELAHSLVARFYGGRILHAVWDLRHGRIGVALDVTGLTPSQIRQTLIAAPIAEGVWMCLMLWWHPALAVWWRWILPVHWGLNAFPIGATDGAQWWRLWRHTPHSLHESAPLLARSR